jgi:nicotinate-nucleotide pyrophosphorylase (carboxylating)
MLTPLQKKRLLQYLREDLSKGDVTASLLPDRKTEAFLRAKENCVVAGLEECAFIAKSKGVKLKPLKKAGAKARKNEKVARLSGKVKAIVEVERTILNVLGRMSGVATICRQAVDIAGKKVKIFATRKTMPGFNEFDKKSTAFGGAFPHRKNLNEMILIKPNHLLFLGSVSGAVGKAGKAKRKAGIKKVEIEVKNLKQALEAAEAGADWIMLDNFSLKQAEKAVKVLRRIAPKVIIECSGGINLKNLRSYAKAGPDIISMGCITKSAGMSDFSLYVVKG